MSEQKKNQPRSDDSANEKTQQQVGDPSGKQTPTMGEGELRPSRSQGRLRPDEKSAEPAHEPGTVGHTRRQNEDADLLDEAAQQANAGAMSGSSRSVKVTRPNRKNRAS